MNTLLKKCLSVILAVVMLCMIAVPVFAESVDKTPVVVIPGVLNTPIIRENGEQVLLPDFSNLSDKQIEELINTLKYILKLQDSKDYSGATTKLIDLLYEYLDGAACNADGTSKYPTHVIKNYNNYNTDSRANESIGREVSKYIGKENVYVFTYDWRGEIINIVDNELAPFIEKIKSDTGAKQVKIACVSMGGAVTSAYLNRYGDRNDVKKVVFVSSAAKGVEFVNSLLEKDITVVREAVGPYFKAFLEQPIPIAATAISGYLKQIIGGMLDSQLDRLWNEFLQPYALKFPAVWELAEHTKSMDQKLEEYNVHPALKQKVKAYYEIQDNYNKTLDKLQKKGVEICFTSNYNLVGVPVTSKAMVSNTDFLITTRQTSNGATVADLFKTLGDNYQQKVAGDKNYVSEDNIIDASTCYSPDKTWFIKNLVHAIITDGDQHSKIVAWLTVNNNTTIDTDEKYPQFLEYTKVKDENGKESYQLVPVEKVVIENPEDKNGTGEYVSSAVTTYTYTQITALGWALIAVIAALIIILIVKKSGNKEPIEGVLTKEEIKALPKGERKAAKKQNKARMKEWKREKKAAKKARKAELKAMPRKERKAAIKADKAAAKARKNELKAARKAAKKQRKIDKKAA
ncbi:MAG: hypothetical protein IJG23_01145, partial [Clostridia bacterium]|nr:hypothetical protein [Clostridia bacterium]